MACVNGCGHGDDVELCLLQVFRIGGERDVAAIKIPSGGTSSEGSMPRFIISTRSSDVKSDDLDVFGKGQRNGQSNVTQSHHRHGGFAVQELWSCNLFIHAGFRALCQSVCFAEMGRWPGRFCQRVNWCPWADIHPMWRAGTPMTNAWAGTSFGHHGAGANEGVFAEGDTADDGGVGSTVPRPTWVRAYWPRRLTALRGFRYVGEHAGARGRRRRRT